jgi:hypothetical protein
MTLIVSGKFIAERLTSVSRSEAALAVTDLKMSARCKQLWHDGWWQRTPTYNQQEMLKSNPWYAKCLNRGADYVEQ